MEELISYLKKLQEGLLSYRDIMTCCSSRQSATEGIPAMIGLSDITEEINDQGIVQQDTDINIKMALDALIFAYLYEDDLRGDSHYPSIALSMSAVAEKYFSIEGENKIRRFSDITQDDINEKMRSGE